MLQTEYRNLKAETLLIKLYRFPVVLIFSFMLVLLLPFEALIRFGLLLPFYCLISPQHKIMHSFRKHSELRCFHVIQGLSYWFHNEDDFPR